MNLLSSIAALLVGNEVYFFIAFAILILLIILLMAWLLLRAKRSAKVSASEQAADSPLDAAAPSLPVAHKIEEVFLSGRDIRRSFRRGLHEYRDVVAGSRNLYLVPWYLTVGEAGAGKSTLLQSIGPNRQPIEMADAQTGRPAGCTWWFYDRAIVLDIGGESILRSDGTPVGERGWKAILDLLARYRRRRPIDGIILAIPAPDLIEPTRQSAAQISKKAVELYAKLWLAQKELGLCLPVYVVITKCDQVPGFLTFLRALPQPLRDDIFGWSNPYPLETAFMPGWVDEAFQSLSDDLLRMQMELFVASEGVDDPDGMFMFPSQLQDMREPLRAYLSAIFKRTAYQEALFLRGIYFTADATAREPAPVPATMLLGSNAYGETVQSAAWLAGQSTGQIAFAVDLFWDKIFAERDLVKPNPHLQLAQNRRQLAWQGATAATVLIGAAMLWWSAARFEHVRATVRPVLDALPEQLRMAGDARGAVLREGQAPQGDSTRERLAQGFMNGVAALDDWRTGLLPGAWISGLKDEVTVALSIGYHRLVLGSVRDQLDKRVRTLTTSGPANPSDTSPPEFGRLKDYVGQLAVFEGFADAFNGAVTSGDAGGLVDLLEYAYGFDIPGDFVERAEQYRFALPPEGRGARGIVLDSDMRPLDIASYKAAAAAKLEELADAYFARLAAGSLATARLQIVARDLDEAVRPNRRPDEVMASFDNVVAGLNDVAQRLGGEGLSWAGSSKLSFDPTTQAILTAVTNSTLLGPAARDRLIGRAEARFAAMQADARLADSIVGPLLARDEARGVVTLSPAAQALRSGLARWLGHGFMRPTKNAGASAGAAGGARVGPVLWDTQTLETATGLAEDFRLFDAQEVPQLPRPMQRIVRSVALGQLQSNIIAAVDRARRPANADFHASAVSAEAEIKEQIRTLKAAAPLLLDVLRSTRQLGVSQAHDVTLDMVVRHAGSLLTSVDRLLDIEQLYRVEGNSLSWWTGDPLTNYEAFGQSSPTALLQYLAASRQRVELLARELADPLVDFLSRPEIKDSTGYVPTAKWTQIVGELDKYANARPNNALGQLEKFITADMAELTPASCLKIARGPDAIGADYFSERLNALRNEVITQCFAVTSDRVQGNYGALSGLFNDNLAGRYPFAGATSAPDAAQASVEAVRDFYRAYDEHGEEVLAALRANERFGESGRQAARFLETMKKLREFLFAKNAEEGADPAFLLDVAFRSNRDAEIGANEIIEWRLGVGETFIDNMQPAKPLEWRVGQPITVSLRWAKDGLSWPIASLGTTPGEVVDRTVVYRFNNAWSLFSLLDLQRAPANEIARSVDRQSRILAFPVLAASGGSAGKNRETPSRAYITITAKRATDAKGKEERLVVPAFPDSAPELSLKVFRTRVGEASRGGRIPAAAFPAPPEVAAIPATAPAASAAAAAPSGAPVPLTLRDR